MVKRKEVPNAQIQLRRLASYAFDVCGQVWLTTG